MRYTLHILFVMYTVMQEPKILWFNTFLNSDLDAKEMVAKNFSQEW